LAEKIDIIKRFQIQTLSAQIHRNFSGPQERQCHCLRSQKGGVDGVDLFKSEDAIRAYYAGLQTCGSVYSCPICAVKITQARQQEIEELLEKTAGKYHYLITLTMPHYLGESCQTIKTKFKAARRRLKNWGEVKGHYEFKPYTRTLKHYLIDGTVTTIDVTYGQNGWHVHSHELIITDKEIKDLKEFRAIVFANWTKALLYSGVEIKKPLAFWKRAVKIDALHGDHTSIMTTYLTKVANSEKWGISAEMTQGQIKKAENKNLTPFGMLHTINDEKDHTKRADLYRKYAPLFYEYCKSFKGDQMIYFSKGLKAKYGMAVIDDKDLVNTESVIELLAQLDQDNQDKVDEINKKLGNHYGFFEKHEWQQIKKMRLRGFIIHHSTGTWDDLRDKLKEKIRRNKSHEHKKKQRLLTETG
jgi:hypothetical protein